MKTNLTAYFLLHLLLLTFDHAMSQQPNTGKVVIVEKKNATLPENQSSLNPDSLEQLRNDYHKRGSGILVTQNKNGVVFKSHLRDYDNIDIELWDQKGELIYQYNNKMRRNIDYNISLGNLPKGRYILNFIYENKLVVCNIHVEEQHQQQSN